MTAKRLRACIACLAGVLASSTAVSAATVLGRTPAAAASPADWHRARRAAILADAPEVQSLIGPDARVLPLLVAVNAAQLSCALAGAHALPTAVLVPCALTLGSTLSLWSFALMHDVAHGSAALPAGLSRKDALFACSMPSVFGYFLYLRYGHLSHHKGFGREPLRSLFDSAQPNFEDGDALFVAHRQLLPGDRAREEVGDGDEDAGLPASIGFFGKEAVGGLGVSISRALFALGWSDDDGSWARNVAVYTFSMAYERAALCVNDKVRARARARAHDRGGRNVSGCVARATGMYVTRNAGSPSPAPSRRGPARLPRAAPPQVTALIGRNLFFPNKPAAFHATCAAHARAQAVVHVAMVALAGPSALLWLYCAELGWQLPCHPAFAMFVSNHPSLDDGSATGGMREGAAGARCQPTASIYWPDDARWFDWLCAFSNFHTEHHDFPDVSLFRLRELRDAAERHYAPPVLADARIGWLPTVKRSFDGRGFYACAGAAAQRVSGDAAP